MGSQENNFGTIRKATTHVAENFAKQMDGLDTPEARHIKNAFFFFKKLSESDKEQAGQMIEVMAKMHDLKKEIGAEDYWTVDKVFMDKAVLIQPLLLQKVADAAMKSVAEGKEASEKDMQEKLPVILDNIFQIVIKEALEDPRIKKISSDGKDEIVRASFQKLADGSKPMFSGMLKMVADVEAKNKKL